MVKDQAIPLITISVCFYIINFAYKIFLDIKKYKNKAYYRPLESIGIFTSVCTIFKLEKG